MNSIAFSQIDPATYNVASLTVTGNLNAAAFVESWEAAASTFTDVDTGALNIAGVVVRPAVTLKTSLGAADGSLDYGGASGRVLTGSASDSSTGYFVPGHGPGSFDVFGTGTVTVPAYATASVSATGPGNFDATFQSSIAATIVLQADESSNSAFNSSDGSVFGFQTGNLTLPLVFGSDVKRITHTFTLAQATTGWSSALAVGGFDPELGQLVGVDVGVNVTGSGSYLAINLDPAGSSFQLSQTATISVASAAGKVLDSASSGWNSSTMLAGYAPDAAGSSGHSTLGPSGSTATTVTDAASLAPFLTAGAVSLTASSTGATSLTGPGNMAVATALAAGATVTVTYDYKPVIDPRFDASYYLAQNPDVAAAGVDPYRHYLSYGWKEGRDPSLMFSTDKYLLANPDVAAAGIDPMAHYSSFGQSEGRATFLAGGTAPADPLVNTAFYDRQLGATLIPTGTAAAQQAAWSYDHGGWQKGLNPDGFFDTSYYLAHNPDVAAAGVDPLLHYELYGWKEGRDPSAQFSTDKYLAAYGDVKAANLDPLLHYVVFGQSEGRTAFHV